MVVGWEATMNTKTNELLLDGDINRVLALQLAAGVYTLDNAFAEPRLTQYMPSELKEIFARHIWAFVACMPVCVWSPAMGVCGRRYDVVRHAWCGCVRELLLRAA